MDEHGRATIGRRLDMGKKTASKGESKARESKRLFAEAVKRLRKGVALNEISLQEANVLRRGLAKDYGVKVAE